ncbi:MAG: alpha/beta fold hydrolase [Hydrogenophaga sp.]
MNRLPAFTTLGDGQTTVLMLHGIGGGHLAFAPQVETLATTGYRAVAWDMPGYGHSAPIEPYTFKGLAEACIRLIDALVGERDDPAPGCPQPDQLPRGAATRAAAARGGSVVLVGHSMGGMVAQEVIARRPDRVSKLVLCGTSAAFGKRRDGQSAEAWARQFIVQRTAPLDAGHTMADMAAQLVPQMVGPAALPEGVRLAEQCMARVPAATYRRALDCIVSFDRQATLAQMGVPTLLVGGEFDRVASPAVMRQMAQHMPRARYVEMAGVGHLMNLEAPDAFDRILLDFLRE